MEQPNGNPCPECGAPRNSDSTPSCACTARASDALRDARTAEAAAAEDFNPLRIRPYVELDGESSRTAPNAPAEAAAAPGAPAAHGEEPAVPRPSGFGGTEGGLSSPRAPEASGPSGGAAGTHDGTGTPGTAVPPEPGSSGAVTASGGAHGGAEASDETMTLRAVPPEAAARAGAADPTSVLPTPLAPSATAPSATDLHLFETPPPAAVRPAPPGPDGDDDDVPPRRRRRGVLFAAAGAVVAVVGAAGWAAGLFAYETPSRDGAAPGDVRVGVPDPSSSDEPSATPTTAASSAPPAPSASASASPSGSASTSASPSPSASSTTPGPSGSAEPSQTPTTSAATDPAEETGEDEGVGAPPVLRRGDRGPEVTELQLRLRQLYLYNDEINGQFNRRLEEALRNYQWSRGLHDELSVYGPRSRARLESETQEP